MPVIRFSLLFLTLGVTAAVAQIQPQTMRPSETMQEPGENWFISQSRGAGHIFDATTGEMYGLINISRMTPAIQPNSDRHEFYATNIFWSRNNYGERTDLLIIHDWDNLTPVAEIEIPKKSMIIPFRNYIGLLSGGRHVASSNMTPAQSVSITDVVDHHFVGEISTPGCALIMPVDNNDFLTLCGDGTLMLVDIDDDGREAGRVRSQQFFDLHDDAVYDRPLPSANGWFLFTHGGMAMNVTVSGDEIDIGESWSLLTDEEREAGWWPGGGQLAALHKDLGVFYVAMHQGERYSHHEPGTEIWVFSTATQRKAGAIKFEGDAKADNLLVTQETEPKLIVGDTEGGIQVYDALTWRFERTIDGPRADLFEDF